MKKTTVKELLLLRHGKSDWRVNVADYYRPLKKRGHRNAKQMGKWLVKQELIPDLLISSPALRALDTARNICKAMQLPLDSIQIDKRIYGADSSALHQILSETPYPIQKIMLIGHNPALEEFLISLVPDIQIPPDGKLMPTATLAYLQLNQKFDLKWGSLNKNNLICYKLQRPKDLSQ
ncbi:MAG: histidine phosphatase family protein [Gammaproteobacteria bacterium]|nr:histidine phosphatase family protein [Gammaproteobacteria bacterium]